MTSETRKRNFNMSNNGITEETTPLVQNDKDGPPCSDQWRRWRLISLSEALQVIPPFFLAGMGTLAAGLLLDEVQHWEVFKTISELFVLVPALLGLKGNLAMTLASRLSTETHRGIDNHVNVVAGYLALDQAQALIVGLLASFIAMITGIAYGTSVSNMVVLFATGLITASLVSVVLGGTMCAIVLASAHYQCNPDNISTPIAASLGDSITLGILSIVGSLLFHIPDKNTQIWICSVVIGLLVLVIPPLLIYSWHNRYARPAVLQGWVPILLAMFISSGVGIIMSKVAEKYQSVVAFLPIINGIGGNLAAIQASRLSTSFNIHGRTDFSEYKTSLFLLLLTVPGHAVFLTVKDIIDPTHIGFPFYTAFFCSAIVQVAILLGMSYVMVMISPYLRNLDPDLYSIPLLTALGDFLGTAFLSLSVLILDSAGLFNPGN
ncbi:hypothetical protein ACHWQZ_G012824 [Mnemiopsis leidyi]